MDTMDQEIIHLVHFFFSDAIGRHEVNGVAQGPEIDPGAEGFAGDGGACIVDIFVLPDIELEGEDGTQGAGIPDDGKWTEGFQECGVAFGNALDPGHTVRFQGEVEAGQGGGAGEGIGGEGVAMEKGFAPVVAEEGFEDLFGGRRCPECHGSPRKAFAKADDVGLLFEIFAGEQPAGPAEPGQDFVGDAKDALHVRFGQQFVEQPCLIDMHAAGGLEERLVDEAGDARTFLADGFAKRVDIFGGGGIDKDDVEEVVAEWGGKDAPLADAHGAESIAVIGMVEGKDPGAGRLRRGYGGQVGGRCGLVPPVLDGHFDGDFDGGRAIVGVEDAGELARQEGEEAFGEVDGGFVGKAGKDHVVKPEGLLIESFRDIGVAVAVDVDPPAADRVDIGLTLVIE